MDCCRRWLACPGSEKCIEHAGLMRQTGVKGGWYWAKCSVRGRSTAERTTKAFQGWDQRISKLAGSLIKTYASKVWGPRAELESQGCLSGSLLIIAEDPRRASQPVLHPLVFPGCIIMRAEVGLGKIQSVPLRVLHKDRPVESHQVPSLEPWGETTIVRTRVKNRTSNPYSSLRWPINLSYLPLFVWCEK